MVAEHALERRLLYGGRTTPALITWQREITRCQVVRRHFRRLWAAGLTREVCTRGRVVKWKTLAGVL
jgi:hypothetical protein